MENQLTESNLSTNTELYDKAWNLFALLLEIGRPVSSIELASRCRFFLASSELVEFLCSIPNSPILLTENFFVTFSSDVFTALTQFLLNSNVNPEFVLRLKLGVLRTKRNWEEVERTYVRKRRRLVPNFECLAHVDKRVLWGNVDEKKDETDLALFDRIQNACAKREDIMDNLCVLSMNTGSVSYQEVDKHKIISPLVAENFICSSKVDANSCEDERVMEGRKNEHIIDSGSHKGNIESLPIKTINRDIVSEVDFENRITLRCNEMTPSLSSEKTISCKEVGEQTIVSPVEAEKLSVREVQNMNLPEDERVMHVREGQPIGSGDGKEAAESLPINTASMDMPCGDDFKRTIMRCNDTFSDLGRDKTADDLVNHVILSADPSSLDQRQLKESSVKLKNFPKDAINPSVQALSNTAEKRKDFGAHVEQQQCKKDRRPIIVKQKLKKNCDQKINTVEKRENSKENREKPSSISVKNHLDQKVLPNFDSYIVDEEEGSGGYGTVYKARSKKDGTTFAVKCPHVNANRHHVQNELKMLERFGGKSFVIKYEGSFKSGNSDCIVLEHVEHDRPEVLKKEIDVFQLQWYGYCLFKALASLHKQGVVHRDVKPGNFLFSRKVNKGYLIDFNLAIDLHQKLRSTEKSRVHYDVTSSHVPIPRTESLPPTKSRKHVSSKASEAVHKEALNRSKSLLIPKNLKRKVDQIKEHNDLGRNSIMKSQGADGSGITSARDGTSSRIPSAERLREPMPCQGRKELINLVHEAMQAPNHEVVSIPASKRKRVVASPGKGDKKLVYLSPMPLHSAGIAVAGAGLLMYKGDGRQRKEGPCVGTKGFRAPEVLFRSTHQSQKVDIWSAGVSLLYLITGRTPFVGDPDQNIKEIAKLRGSEDLWEVAKLHNRELSFPSELFDIQSLPSTKLRDWCKLNTRRPEFLEVIPRSLLDLVDKCLIVNPRLRISAEDALRHEFFAPCIERLKKQWLLRQGLSLDSDTQPQTLEGFS